MKQTEERVVSPEDLSNETNLEIVKVRVDDKGSIMFIGSLSADEYVEWSEAGDKNDPEAKKVTLLGRVPLAIGRAKDGVGFPNVLREPALLRNVGVVK